MTDGGRFARLVGLACHDLRTPLATVYGFARTLRRTPLDDAASRYVGMIEAASEQMGELLDELALVARIESGRFEPVLTEVDTLALARAAASALDPGEVAVRGEGAVVRVDEALVRRALARLARAARRHGGLESVALAVRGPVVELSPVAATAAAVVTGEELGELGAAAAVALVAALGGALELEGERLLIRLPQ